MHYGLYISTSGALHATYKQDLYTSNLANMNTAGFKPDLTTTRQRDPARVEDGLPGLPSSDLLERLSAGVMGGPTRTDFTQGDIRSTGNPLDLAIRGDGFFTLLDSQDRGLQRFRLTRDGRFTRNAAGEIVSIAGGLPLVDTNGRPIRLPGDGPVAIGGDGTISQNGAEVGKIGFVDVPNRNALTKGPNGLFVPDSFQIANRHDPDGLISQGALEESAVNEIDALMKIESAARDAQTNIGMIGYHDRLLDQAINRFARVA